MTCLGRASYYLLTLPWVFLCTVTAIFDVVAVVFFFYDLFNTLVRLQIVRDRISEYKQVLNLVSVFRTWIHF